MNYDQLEEEYEYLKIKKDLTDDEKVELCVLRQMFGKKSLSFTTYEKADARKKKQEKFTGGGKYRKRN